MPKTNYQNAFLEASEYLEYIEPRKGQEDPAKAFYFNFFYQESSIHQYKNLADQQDLH